MAILENQRHPSDIPDTVRDLVQAVSVLSRSIAPNMLPSNAFTLQEILQRILARSERCEWEETADHIRDALRVVERKT